jgi:hypothetical protein
MVPDKPKRTPFMAMIAFLMSGDLLFKKVELV